MFISIHINNKLLHDWFACTICINRLVANKLPKSLVRWARSSVCNLRQPVYKNQPTLKSNLFFWISAVLIYQPEIFFKFFFFARGLTHKTLFKINTHFFLSPRIKHTGSKIILGKNIFLNSTIYTYLTSCSLVWSEMFFIASIYYFYGLNEHAYAYFNEHNFVNSRILHTTRSTNYNILGPYLSNLNNLI